MKNIVEKASNLQIYDQEKRDKLLFITCAVIRKYFYDKYPTTNKEECDMELKKDSQNRSYQFGRLLAVLEKLESDAIRNKSNKNKEKIRETNAIRSQAYFCKRPCTAFTQIMEKLKTGYYPDLYEGQKIKYEKLIGEIVGKIYEMDGYENKPLSEEYMLGYYMQKNELYKPSEVNDTKNIESTEEE